MSFPFSEKIGRAQIQKARNIFLWCCRAERGGGGFPHLRIFDKVSSSEVVKTLTQFCPRELERQQNECPAECAGISFLCENLSSAKLLPRQRRGHLKMKYSVYIAHSLKTGIYYVGYTSNVIERLKYHNSGKTKSMRRHIPLSRSRHISAS